MANSRADQRILLEQLPLMKGSEPAALDALISVAQHRSFLAGAELCRIGDSGSALWLLLCGVVEQRVGEGEHAQICRVVAGGLLGETVLFRAEEQRTMSAMVLEDCELLVLDTLGLATLAQQGIALTAQIEAAVLASVAGKILAAQAHIEQDLLKKAASAASQAAEERAAEPKGLFQQFLHRLGLG